MYQNKKQKRELSTRVSCKNMRYTVVPLRYVINHRQGRLYCATVLYYNRILLLLLCMITFFKEKVALTTNFFPLQT